MNDRPKDHLAETPIQRALRMKKAALKAKPEGPASANQQRRTVARVAAGASKPWLKK
jgi:hypothetical protein